MKKKVYLFVLFILVSSVLPINAAAGDLTIKGDTSVAYNKSIILKVDIPSGYVYDLNIKSSDPSVISIAIAGGGAYCEVQCVEPTGTIEITVNGKKAGGTAMVSLSGTVSDLHGVWRNYSVSKSITVNPISEPTQEKKPTSKPTPEKLDNTEADKIAPTVSPEELAKQEAERKKNELEALRKIPLISDVEIISQSEKYQGDVLETLKATDNVFDFEYTLPKRIDEFSLNINAPEDVTLTYDEKYKFEAEENEKTVVVKASKGEVGQTFNVLVKRNVFESVEKTVFESAYAVYDDERLDDFVKTLKAEKIDDTHFKFADLLFQLVVDEDNNAKWLLLNEDLSEQAFGLIHLNDDGEVLFILESDDLESETLYGEKYSNKELVLDERISAIDPSLKFETTYKGTNFDDGVIVYAMNSKGIKGNHFISSDNSFTFAAVAFDQVNMTYKYVAWFSSVALIALVGALVLTKVLDRKKSI